MSEKEILIQKNQLEMGFKKCQDKILGFAASAKILYDKKQFPESISLSILGYEEIGKLDFIRICIKKNKNITKQEWMGMSRPGSHSYKLLSFYQLALDDVKNLSEAEYNRIVEDEKKKGSPIKFKKFSEIGKNEDLMKKRFSKLNDIKKACFYTDFENGKWISIEDVYSEHELELLANFLLDFTNFGVLTEILNKKYPLNFYHQIPKEVNLMMQDEIWIEREKYVRAIYTEEYQKFLTGIDYLIDRFPKSL